MPKIKRIIEGQQTITTSQDIDAPAGLDVNRSIITATIQNAQGAAPDFHIVTRLESISGVPKIRFIRQNDSTNASATIHYRITEFQSGARVQHGQVALNQFTQSVTNGYRANVVVPFKFILNKSVVLISQNGDNANFGSRDTMAAQLTSGNIIQITTGSTASTSFTDIVYWQLVEFTDDTIVERGSVTGNGVVTATVSTMDLSKCWLIGTARNDGLNAVGMNNYSFTSWISNTTTLSFEKPGGTTGVRIYEWQLVRFNDGTVVRQGIQTIAGGTGSSTPTFTAVNKANSTLFFNGHCGFSGASNDGTSNNGTAASFYVDGMEFTSTQIVIRRNSSVSQLKVGWTVIQFDSGEDEKLRLKNSIVDSVTLSSSDTTVSVNLPAGLDLSKSFLMFTYSVASSTSPGPVFIRGKIWNDSGTKKATFVRASSGSVAATINYQIFEFKSGINVYHGESTVATTLSPSIGGTVDLSKSIVLATLSIAGTGGFAQAEAFRAKFSSATTIQLDCTNSTGTKVLNWQVIEFLNDCTAFETEGSTSTTSVTIQTNSTLLQRPSMIALSYTAGVGAGTTGNFFARAYPSDTSYILSRQTTGLAFDFSISAVHFKGSDVKGHPFSFPSPSNGESSKNLTLPAPVNTSQTLLMLTGRYNTAHESSSTPASTAFGRLAFVDSQTISVTRGEGMNNGWASGCLIEFSKGTNFSPSGGISLGSFWIV